MSHRINIDYQFMRTFILLSVNPRLGPKAELIAGTYLEEKDFRGKTRVKKKI